MDTAWTLTSFTASTRSAKKGLKDKVNNHYLEIFGASIALGVIAGAGEIAQGGGAISTSGSQAFTTGAAGSVSQSATTILDRFMQIPPTITIREGHRVKVYFTQDMLLPAYKPHHSANLLRSFYAPFRSHVSHLALYRSCRLREQAGED